MALVLLCEWVLSLVQIYSGLRTTAWVRPFPGGLKVVLLAVDERTFSYPGRVLDLFFCVWFLACVWYCWRLMREHSVIQAGCLTCFFVCDFLAWVWYCWWLMREHSVIQAGCLTCFFVRDLIFFLLLSCLYPAYPPTPTPPIHASAYNPMYSAAMLSLQWNYIQAPALISRQSMGERMFSFNDWFS